MSWYTLEDAARRGPSRPVWEELLAAGVVDGYRDGVGRTWVWVDEGRTPAIDPRRLRGAYEALARRVATVEEALRAAQPPAGALEPEPAAPEPARTEPPLVRLEPTARAAEPEHARLLTLVAARWDGSERELERQAGLPKAFLAKAKRGERGGPRSAVSWARLEAFLGQLARRAA